MLLQHKPVEFVTALQNIHPKYFAHQAIVLPRKTPKEKPAVFQQEFLSCSWHNIEFSG
jgi:hypothetical protein